MADTVLALIMFLISCVLARVDAGESCMFPREMYGTIDNWRILSPDPRVTVPHIMRQVRFDYTDLFTLYYMDQYGETGIVDTETYECVEALRNKTYILKRARDDGGSVDFLCLQFVLRDQNVVQWRLSEGRALPGDLVCDDQDMVLMDAPLIYYRTPGFWQEERNELTSYRPCPLEGGYVLQWRIPGTEERLCQQDVPPLKFESECETGQGITFHVTHSHDNCQGADYEIINSPYQCLASWERNGFLFTVLVRPQDSMRHIMCLRVPVLRGDKFTGELFLDAVCDSTDDLSQTMNYRELTFRRHLVPNLCEDETPDCDRYEGRECDFPEAEVCRKSCGVCSPEDVGIPDVKFPRSFQGDWLKHTERLGKEFVSIQERSIVIPSTGTYSILSECSTQRQVSPSNKHAKSYEYLMLRTYDNGCSPRVSTLNLAQHDASSLAYRTGAGQLASLSLSVADDASWVVNNQLWGFKCDSMHYGADPGPLYDTYRPFQGGWFNLVNTDPAAAVVDCALPFSVNASIRDEHGHLAVRLKTASGAVCEAKLRDDLEEASTLRMEVTRCRYDAGYPSDEPAPLPGHAYHFSCLSRAVSKPSDHVLHKRVFLITRAIQQGEEHTPSLTGHAHTCWLFLPERGTVYWTNSGECDANTEHHIDAGFKRPAAYLTFHQSNSAYMNKPAVWAVCILVLTLLVSTVLTYLIY